MKSVKVKCFECTRRVDIGAYTGTYVLHNNKSRQICSGAGKPIPTELLQMAKLLNQKTPVNRKNNSVPSKSGSLIAQFEINQQATIKRSLTEERAVKEAQRFEVGSRTSVRSISGGLPTLGKNS